MSNKEDDQLVKLLLNGFYLEDDQQTLWVLGKTRIPFRHSIYPKGNTESYKLQVEIPPIQAHLDSISQERWQ